MLGGEVLFIPSAWPRLSWLSRAIIILLVPPPYITLYLAVFSSPGAITSDNHAAALRLYPYDHVLFHPGRECRTCHMIKPARSKHCSICKICVSRSDHHCVWINNCVGYSNYHWFLLMMLSTAFLLSYGGWLGHSILTSALKEGFHVIDGNWSTGLSWSDYLNAWIWAINQEIFVGAAGFLSALCAPLAWGLVFYHLYLIWAGTTTNETGKWTDLREDMQDGMIFKANRSELRASSGLDLRDYVVDMDPEKCWPVVCDQIVIQTTDGNPPTKWTGWREDGGSPWQKVRDLGDVHNIYDLGFWDNLQDVFASRR